MKVIEIFEFEPTYTAMRSSRIINVNNRRKSKYLLFMSPKAVFLGGSVESQRYVNEILSTSELGKVY